MAGLAYARDPLDGAMNLIEGHGGLAAEQYLAAVGRQLGSPLYCGLRQILCKKRSAAAENCHGKYGAE